MVCLLEDFFKTYSKALALSLLSQADTLKKSIQKAEIQRPGLSLIGYLRGFVPHRFLVFGKTESHYLQNLDHQTKKERFNQILKPQTPAVFVCKGCYIFKELKSLCQKMGIALISSELKADALLFHLTANLKKECALFVTVHGTFIDIFGRGVLLQGNTQAGKSEAALSLLEKGHGFVADDIIRVKKLESGCLEGSSVPIARYHMHVRELGVINVMDLFGVSCLREQQKIDLAIHLKRSEACLNNLDLDCKKTTEPILGVDIPRYYLSLKETRNYALLIEMIVQKHVSKQLGMDVSKNFEDKLYQLRLLKK